MVVSVIALAIVSFYVVHGLFSFTAGIFNSISGLSFSDAFNYYWVKETPSSGFVTFVIDALVTIIYIIKTDEP
jgi:hypothetical protein